MKMFSLLLAGALFLHEFPLKAVQPTGYVIEWGYPPNITNSVGVTNCIEIAGEIVSNAIAVNGTDAVRLALKADGTVAGWGGNYRGQAVGYETPNTMVTNGLVRISGEVLSNVVSIAAAEAFNLALKKDGTVATWGRNYVPAGLSNIVGIAAEWGGSWGLRKDGTVVGWTSDKGATPSTYGRLLEIENLSNIVAIAVGTGGDGVRGVALKNDGTVANWGGETIYKDASPPNGLSNVVAIAAGYNHSLALKNDGTVVGWGFNDLGQATGVPTPSAPNGVSVSSGLVTIDGQVLGNVVTVAAHREVSMALKKDGTVVVWGNHRPKDVYPRTVPAGLSNVVAIAAADNIFLAITTNRAVADRFRRIRVAPYH